MTIGGPTYLLVSEEGWKKESLCNLNWVFILWLGNNFF